MGISCAKLNLNAVDIYSYCDFARLVVKVNAECMPFIFGKAGVAGYHTGKLNVTAILSDINNA